MHIIAIILTNVGIVRNATIRLDKVLTFIFGDIKQGKTTILNAVRWALGGPVPDDLITHGEDHASIRLELDKGYIQRNFVLKDNKTVARPIEFMYNGEKIKRPAEQIRMVMDPFIMNEEKLSSISDKELSSMLINILNVDTSDIDTAIAQAEETAKELRIEIKSYGDIDLTPVEVPDKEALIIEKQAIQATWERATEEVNAHNKYVMEAAARNNQIKMNRENIEHDIKDLRARIAKLQQELTSKEQALKNIPEYEPVPEMKPHPPAPDTSEIDDQLNQIAALEVKREAYEANLRKQEEKEGKEVILKDTENFLRQARADRLSRLRERAEKSPIPGLGFNEDGAIVYENTSLSMLSTSQKKHLSSAIKTLYPNSIRIELIDQGESLGTSIYQYIDHAKEHKLNILASIVGEKPAKVPEDVGVFVVKNGEVS